MGEYNTLLPHQKLMHFPKTGLLCTKDNLARTIKKCQTIHGSCFDFIPTTFILPNEYKKCMNVMTQSYDDDEPTKNRKQKIWICKPTDLSRGRGISIINNINDLKYD
jgi:tubulin polyglutamylase TTLL2